MVNEGCRPKSFCVRTEKSTAYVHCIGSRVLGLVTCGSSHSRGAGHKRPLRANIAETTPGRRLEAEPFGQHVVRYPSAAHDQATLPHGAAG